MAYFKHHEDCRRYPNDWNALLNYIKTEWPKDELGKRYSSQWTPLEHQIEVKALYVVTMSRHLIYAAELLAQDAGWQPVFVEASLLLFPMLELVGQARLGDGTASALAGGIDWLRDPRDPPRRRTDKDLYADQDRVGTLGRYMSTLSEGPMIRELAHLRNYLTHGLKNQRDSLFDIEALQTSMNYELPRAIVQQAKVGMAEYWHQLADGPDHKEWVTRLAKADIHPFGIMGSQIYEKGLIDPDIMRWLRSL
jgi:hypothetical protein